jgi:hypothetical protein
MKGNGRGIVGLEILVVGFGFPLILSIPCDKEFEIESKNKFVNDKVEVSIISIIHSISLIDELDKLRKGGGRSEGTEDERL